MSNKVLSGLKLRWNSECVDGVVGRQDVRRRPLSVGRLSKLSYLEPNGAGQQSAILFRVRVDIGHTKFPVAIG